MKREMLEKVHNAHKNLIVNGDISVGKTKNVILPLVKEMIDNKESIVFLDSKEEYLHKYYNDFKEKDYNIIILNFRDLDKSEGWNPLEYPYKLYKEGNKDRANDYLDKIGRAMFYEGDSQDPFWSNSASDFFTGVTLGLFDDGEYSQVNLNSVNAMFNGINKRYGSSDYLTKYFDLKDKNSSAYTYASGSCYSPKETRGGILSVVKQRLNVCTSREKLSFLLGKTTFDFDLITQKPTVFFVIGKDENKNKNVIPTMFIEQLFEILLDKNSNRQYNFILDNFDTIENINSLSDMLSSGLSRKIKFVIGTRSVNDVIKKYGDYLSKLCNFVYVDNKKIELNLDGDKIIEDNLFEDIDESIGNVNYPKLENNKIGLFDLNKYVIDNVKEYNKESTEKKETNSSFPDYSVDELISRIDDKIAELDRAEDNKK